jgi:hypothetical protein
LGVFWFLKIAIPPQPVKFSNDAVLDGAIFLLLFFNRPLVPNGHFG